MDERGAWLEEGSIGKSDRVVSLFAAKDMVVKIGQQVLPLKENQTLEVFGGSVRLESGSFDRRRLPATCRHLCRYWRRDVKGRVTGMPSSWLCGAPCAFSRDGTASSACRGHAPLIRCHAARAKLCFILTCGMQLYGPRRQLWNADSLLLFFSIGCLFVIHHSSGNPEAVSPQTTSRNSAASSTGITRRS